MRASRNRQGYANHWLTWGFLCDSCVREGSRRVRTGRAGCWDCPPLPQPMSARHTCTTVRQRQIERSSTALTAAHSSRREPGPKGPAEAGILPVVIGSYSRNKSPFADTRCPLRPPRYSLEGVRAQRTYRRAQLSFCWFRCLRHRRSRQHTQRKEPWRSPSHEPTRLRSVKARSHAEPNSLRRARSIWETAYASRLLFFSSESRASIGFPIWLSTTGACDIRFDEDAA